MEHSNHIKIDLGYSYSDFKGGIVAVREVLKGQLLKGNMKTVKYSTKVRWKCKICLRQGSLKVMRG